MSVLRSLPGSSVNRLRYLGEAALDPLQILGLAKSKASKDDAVGVVRADLVKYDHQGGL